MGLKLSVSGSNTHVLYSGILSLEQAGTLIVFPGQMLGLQKKKKKKKLERSRFHHLGQSNQLRKTSLNQLQMEDNASWLH